MLSHLLPYLLCVVPAAVGEHLPPHVRAWSDPVAVLLTGAALVHFARRGAYGELRPREAPRGATLLALGAGLGVALLWMPLSEIVPRGVGARAGFHPEAAGAGAAPILWGSRILGTVLVIPVAEELLVRSLLPRWMDAMDAWRERPVGEFTRLSAAVSVGFFALTHPEWLAALATGILWTLLLARTRRLRDVLLSHAAANALLAVYWVATGDLSWW